MKTFISRHTQQISVEQATASKHSVTILAISFDSVQLPRKSLDLPKEMFWISNIPLILPYYVYRKQFLSR